VENQNGTEPARVRFDRDRPDKTISLEDAETMLMAWRARNPGQFGYWLAEAITGTPPAKTSRSGAVQPAGQ
jgi:hypothetical protein